MSGWRKVACDITFFTVVMQLFAPLLLSCMAAGSGASRAETALLNPLHAICTATGIVYAQPGEGRSSPPVSADCPYCQLAEPPSAGLIDTSPCIPTPTSRLQDRLPEALKHAQARIWAIGKPTRAPPV